MAKVSVLPLDSFVVLNKTVLNDQNRLVLILLYQPIVGSMSINLYMTLWSYLDDNISANHLHQDLITSMQAKLEDILEAREKLEAIGLIKTFLKKGDINNYVYELYAPLTAYDFMNNPILHTSLKNNISNSEYKRIVNKYTIPKLELSEYQDISCSFKDIFSFVSSDIKISNIKKASTLGLSFESTINFNELLSLIPEDYLNYKTVTKGIRELICQLAFIYNLNNENMTSIIENSILDRKIDIALLQNNCQNYYRFENVGKIPIIAYNCQPLTLRANTSDNSREAKITREFETTSPYDYLMLKQGGTKPTINDLKIIEYLMIEQKLLPGVVNVLIDYVLKINNNKLVKAFVEQIATQWKRSKVNTVNDAINMARKEFDSTHKKQKKQLEKKPSWLDQNIEEDILSKEEIEALQKELRGNL